MTISGIIQATQLLSSYTKNMDHAETEWVKQNVTRYIMQKQTRTEWGECKAQRRGVFHDWNS